MNKPSKPDYYAVIFSSQRSDSSEDEYVKMANEMEALAKKQSGFRGIESFRDQQGRGVTISYWDSESDIVEWKRNAEHVQAQIMGKKDFYDSYHLRVCRVEREYQFGWVSFLSDWSR